MRAGQRDIPYHADGTDLVGRLALPDGDGARPCVLIAHEGGGLDEHQKSRAGRFADLGLVAFALDYHGGGRPIEDEVELSARCHDLWTEPERIRALALAGLEVLLEEPRADASRVAAVGYCFGGAVVLELARSGALVVATVGFHPRLATRRPKDASKIKGRVLVCVGSEDPYVSAEERAAFEDEMRSGGVDWQMNVYGGAQHSFTRPGAEKLGRPGLAYDEGADGGSWRAMLDLFEVALWRGGPS